MRWQLPAAVVLCLLAFAGAERALPAGELRDFGSFVASADAAARGDDPYGIHRLTFHVVLPEFEVWNPNLNPPISLILFRPFLATAPETAFRWFWIFSLACYLLTIGALAWRYAGADRWLVVLWALSLAGFWDTLVLGQIYLPLVMAAAGSWLLLERGRPWSAGVLMGLVIAVKPNFVVWPVVLLLAGHARPPLAALTTAATLSLLPLFTHGPVTYQQWLEVILRDGHRIGFLTNASIAGLAQRAGYGTVGTVLSLGLLCALALWARRQRPDHMTASAMGIVAAIAASPIAWVHYTLFLLPVFFSVRLSRVLLAGAALLAVPVPFVLRALGAPALLQLTAGSLYNWAVLLCLAGLALSTGAARHPATDDQRMLPGRLRLT